MLAVISEYESEKFNNAFWPWYTEQAEYKSTIKPQIDQLEEDFFDDKVEGFSGSLVTKTIQDAIDKEFGPSIRRKSEKLDTEYQEVRKKLEEDFAKKFPNGSCDRGVPSISQYRAGLKSGESQRIFATDCFKKEDVELDSAFNMHRGDEPYFDNSNIFGRIGNFIVDVADTVITAGINAMKAGKA